MLRTLLESNAAPTRRRGGILVSIGLHTAAIALAVVTTARANIGPTGTDPWARPPVYTVIPLPSGGNHSRPRPPDSRGVCECMVPPIVGVPPVTISIASPRIDDKLPTIQDDFSGQGAATCLHCSGDPGLGDARSEGLKRDSIHTGLTVDLAARPKSGNPAPVYPSALRSAQVEGTVVARFVVDSVGRAEPASISILQTTHPLFADAVRQALLHSRYEPAMVGNRRVRQLVDQRFTFSLIR